jgi:hypothetical protein
MGRRSRKIKREQNRILFSTDEIIARGQRIVEYARSAAHGASSDVFTIDGATAGFALEAAERLEGAVTLMGVGQTGNAIVLLRPVYECAVTYAWIAAAPEERLLKLYETLEYDELKMAKHLREFGVPFLMEQIGDARLVERISVLKKGGLPTLLRMAVEADEHWAEPMHFTDHVSFAGLYANLFRGASGGYSHPRSGLVRRLSAPGTQVTKNGNFWLAVGPSLLGWMLEMGASHVEWLSTEASHSAINGVPVHEVTTDQPGVRAIEAA